jgi:hypothetical protein
MWMADRRGFTLCIHFIHVLEMSIKRILRSIQLVQPQLTLSLGNVSWNTRIVRHDSIILHILCVLRVKASYNTVTCSVARVTKWRVLFRIIGFIRTSVTHSLLITLKYRHTQFSLVFTGLIRHETTDGLTWFPVRKERKDWTVFRHWNCSHINMSSRINIDTISQSQLPAWWTADACTHSITAERSTYKSIKHSVQFVTSLSVLCPFRSINRRRYCILSSHILLQACSEECKQTRYCTRAKFYLVTSQPCNWYTDYLPSCLAYQPINELTG